MGIDYLICHQGLQAGFRLGAEAELGPRARMWDASQATNAEVTREDGNLQSAAITGLKEAKGPNNSPFLFYKCSGMSQQARPLSQVVPLWGSYPSLGTLQLFSCPKLTHPPWPVLSCLHLGYLTRHGRAGDSQGELMDTASS